MDRSSGFGSTPCYSTPLSDSLSLRLPYSVKLATQRKSLTHYTKGTQSPLHDGLSMRPSCRGASASLREPKSPLSMDIIRICFLSETDLSGPVSSLSSFESRYRAPRKNQKPIVQGLPLFVCMRFQVLFHSPPGVLFAFPSRYWFTIGRSRVFSLGGWSPHVQTGFHVPRPTCRQLSTTPLLSHTGLSPTTAGLSIPFC